MKSRTRAVAMLGMALALMGAGPGPSTAAGTAPPRPQGPCDIYAAGGAPCVAAHSTTRALYANYDGPLYRVMRQSDGKTLDIGVVQPVESPAPDPGGYADAAAQDAFCAGTYCWITTIYDQSGHGNDLVQAPRGGFGGPAMGGFNNLPLADMAPITIMGHKAYGVFIEPGMGLRRDDAKGTAVDDQAQGQYWVVDGRHYNSGCCFDYGNAEIDSRDDGDGTMETTYFGNATPWYHGNPPGPWVMTDQENNLVGCVNESPDDKSCPDLPSITWRFVTATADGEPHHWRSMGGNAQKGDLRVMYDGPRVRNDRSSYDPMRKQGAILLGNGGDNSNGSQGTFYEGAMTAGGTFPTKETDQRVQANVAAAGYDVARLSLAPASAVDAPPRLQTFSPGSSQETTIRFTNTTGAPATGVKLLLSAPAGWSSTVAGSGETSKTFAGPVAPGASVSATFTVTSGTAAFNGDLVGKASWTNATTGTAQSGTTAEKVRNVSPIRINEFRISAGSRANSTDAFIELYNAGGSVVDISNFTLVEHPTQQPVFSSVKIPAGTKLAAHGFYLLGLANSGLAVPAHRGDATLYVRNTDGMSVGDVIEVGTGSGVETRRITRVGTAAGLAAESRSSGGRPGAAGGATTLWQPLPEGPVITIPVGSTNVPVTSVAGFDVGQKMAIGYGATYPTVAKAVEKYEVVTVTRVGKPGTQAYLSAEAKAGDTNIKVSSVENISVGDRIRLDIDSEGHGIETVTVTGVGTPSVRSTFGGPLKATEDAGTGLDLAEPLKFDHASNLPFSVRGTGISFEPATAFAHSSNEPVLPLGTGITLDRPLANDHAIDAVVRDAKVTTAGYQGAPAPDQWFGGPDLGPRAGTLVLRDAAGRVVDSQNYGGLVDPWAAEGYQAASGAGESGCSAPAPEAGRFGFFGARGGTPPASPNRSAGRFPDGRDEDSNCTDFRVQAGASLAAASAAGASNIKVASVEGFAAGQTIVIDGDADAETAVIAKVGTAGATTVDTATEAGATVIPVANPIGFREGQTITIGRGADQETAVVASIRRRFSRGRRSFALTVAAPLARAHRVGAEVSGSGITLTQPLKRAHDDGAPVANGVPTPGAPNRYY
ncbi:MAG TPA: arabinofuranosidase catalytic domain-containing protein [Longimicrobiaceae bacterium]|nr:arabinofuranosidase catalytic domain-containing protein [Longimicrobiaceae bacterium]